ncbi:MAG: replicative DNA helicase [Chlamydiae bacterium]|nr:replicative DNA helicase [Chlamydiota bacterium]
MKESPQKGIVPPSSKESEMMVLGCMLTSINSLNIASDALNSFDFYYTEHQTIFDILKTAYKQDKPADVHLVCEELKRQEKLSAVGGVSYVTTLAQYAGTSAYIEEYVDVVRNKATLRRMIHVAQDIEKNALQNPQDVSVALDEAQQKLFNIGQAINANGGVLIREILSGVKSTSKIPYLKELQQKQESFQERGPGDLGITGVPSHFIDLDKMINGMAPSNLMILAARPAMGKTALAINIAENICFRSEIPVGIFSLEMSADQLLHRLICSQAEVESDKIKSGSLNGSEFQRIVAAVNSMQKGVMVIDDQPGLKITDLRARARRMKEAHGIQFLVIDYLQLLSGSGVSKSAENRQSEISEISRMLKNLARELNLPILCLSQLSRKVEERPGHRPMMSDLRESGCLTGDAEIRDAHTGKIHTIRELAERKEQTPISVYAVDENLKVGPHKMIKAFYSGQKEVYELKTRSGRSIKASANHPFLKLEGWTRLDQLQKGTRIALPRQFQEIESSNPISNEELTLFAHLLGDGCILPNQPYHYTSADLENIEHVSNSAHSLFGIQPRLVKQKNWYHLYLPSPTHLTHKKYHPISSWFENYGLDRVRSYEKKIPKAVFECNSHKISTFLHHLWATDGNISLVRSKNRKEGASIYYASSSKEMCKQTQSLLLSLGIQSTLATVPSSKGYRNMHHVRVQGAANQKIFLSKVGSAGKRGHIKSELLIKLNEISENPNCDTIPKEAWRTVVKQAKEEANLGWREVYKGINTAYCGTSLFKNGISRQRMEKLATVLPSKQLHNLAHSDVYWDEILSIEKLGIEDVYDATVENVHNFVANDILVHNSIEQDSDIVMFLLRREYYDPYDKPGMAELIVAKNRHGGVGSVNLTFRKELAQFSNYSASLSEGKHNDNQEAFSAFSPN